MRVGALLVAVSAVCFAVQSAYGFECAGVPSRITGPLVNVKPGTVVLCSPNGRYALIFNSAGNLVVYDGNEGNPIWASNTHGTGETMAFQSDGNLVVYGSATFATNTAYPYPNPPLEFSLQLQGEDGNLVLLRPEKLAPGQLMPLWSSQNGPTNAWPVNPVMTKEQLAYFIQQLDAKNKCPKKVSKIIFYDNKDRYSIDNKPPPPDYHLANALNFVAQANLQSDSETYLVPIGEIDFGALQVEDLAAALKLSRCFQPPPVNISAYVIDHGSPSQQDFGDGALGVGPHSQVFFQILGSDLGVTHVFLQGCKVGSAIAMLQQLSDWLGGKVTGNTQDVANAYGQQDLDDRIITNVLYQVGVFGTSAANGGVQLTTLPGPSAQSGKNHAAIAACGVTSVAWSKSENGRSRYCLQSGPAYAGFNGSAQSACFAACGSEDQSPGGCVASCQDNFHAFCVGAWSCTGDVAPPRPPPDWSGTCRVQTTCKRDRWPTECSASFNAPVPNLAGCNDWINRLGGDINLQYQVAMQCKEICGAEYMYWDKEGNTSTLWIRK